MVILVYFHVFPIFPFRPLLPHDAPIELATVVPRSPVTGVRLFIPFTLLHAAMLHVLARHPTSCRCLGGGRPIPALGGGFASQAHGTQQCAGCPADATELGGLAGDSHEMP